MTTSRPENRSADTGTDRGSDSPRTLYFFPSDEVTEAELKEILAGDDPAKKAWAVSHLLRFAQWEDIWAYVTRDEVREIFPELEMPEKLTAAWARILKIEASVC